MTDPETSGGHASKTPRTLEIRPNHPSQRTVTEFGAVCFLAARSKRLQGFPVGALSHWWDMPLALGQYWVFRHEGVPRAAISWAALSSEAERRYVVERKGLTPQDWRSGPQIWVIDWIAPFQIKGLNAQLRRWLATSGFPKAETVRFMRLSPEGETRYILEIQRTAPDTFDRRVLSVEEVAKETEPEKLDER
ncbi:toxin-activating lysine-acyltransferase [Cribrihabitans sp. XS_ASV171]